MGAPNPFHATSVEDVQQRQTAWEVLHGAKRCHDQIHVTSPHGATLGDITAASNVQDTEKRRRARILPRNRITASRICSVAGSADLPSPGRPSGRTAAPIPGPSQNPLLSLHHPRYGLPKPLVDNLASLGINSIYPWQSSCLLGRGLLDGKRNLVYTAPTGGGKSLVADVLMLKRVVQYPSKKAILVLPYVALVQEKLKWLRKVVENVTKDDDEPDQASSQITNRNQHCTAAIRVIGFFGGSRTRARWSDFDVAVCTIEKVCTVPLNCIPLGANR